MARQLIIVGLGEALFDLLPRGKALGGAPLNVACHAHQLLSGSVPRHPHSSPLPEGEGMGVIASRIGTDELGDALLVDVAQHGMTSDYIQRDPAHPTGVVRVELQDGQPSYEIVEGVAWDHFEWTPAWQDLAGRCAAVSFGTLAQRSPESRHAIWQFLDTAEQAVRLLDVNLRQHFYDRTVLEESCRRATLVKLNEHELPVLAELLELRCGRSADRATSAGSGDPRTTADRATGAGPGDSRITEVLAELRAKYDLDAVVYTRGQRGTLLVLESGLVDPPPVSYPPEADADTIGAGDACAAGILVGWVRKLPPARIASLANHLGAFVASRRGATPKLPPEILEMTNDE